MPRTIIFNADIVNEFKRFNGYLIIDGELIADIQEGNPSKETLDSCNEKIDAEGNFLFPGAIDDQVHFRDPGLTHKADVITESKAAAAGGITSFMDMPNTKPATITVDDLERKIERASKNSYTNFSYFIGGTNDNIEVLKKIDYSRTCGVKLFLGSSTGNMLVDNKAAIERIFSEIPSVIAIHSEDENIINTNKQKYIAQYGDNLPIEFHSKIRSEEACYQCTARAVELAQKCGTRLNVLHLSTAKELSLFEKCPLPEKKITGEVCVHHLWFSEEDYARLGNNIKCNPAIKTINDRNALREALNNDILDLVATDHAPHLLSEKEGNCLTAASGIPLVQFSLLMMLEMADKGIFTVENVIHKMCHAPAIIYRVVKRGFLRKGYYADIVIVNKNKPTNVTGNIIHSKCGWSPFEGESFKSSVNTTFVNGVKIYQNGTFNDSAKGQLLRFSV